MKLGDVADTPFGRSGDLTAGGYAAAVRERRERQFRLGAEVRLDELEGDVHRVLAALRPTEPVSWIPALSGWLVIGRAEALQVMRDPSTFTVDDPRFSTGQVIGPSMLSLDGDEHTRHRAPWVAPFRPAAVDESLAEWTRQAAEDRVASLTNEPTIELRSHVAAPLAVDVISHALGLSAAPRVEVLGWYRGIVAAVSEITAGAAVSDRGRQAFASLSRGVSAAIDAGTSAMLAEVAADGDLMEAEIIANAAVVMFGAIETSEGMTANALWHLFTNPDVLAATRADRSLIPDVIEESLRMEPAATVVDRYATADVRVGGAEITAGDYVSVSLAGANRDPAEFPEPDTFNPHRENRRNHLAFVRGPHACIGAHLARIETQAAIEAVLTHLPDHSLDSEATTAPTGLVFRKPARVVISR